MGGASHMVVELLLSQHPHIFHGWWLATTFFLEFYPKIYVTF